jgi:hypothetical protein
MHVPDYQQFVLELTAKLQSGDMVVTQVVNHSHGPAGYPVLSVEFVDKSPQLRRLVGNFSPPFPKVSFIDPRVTSGPVIPDGGERSEPYIGYRDFELASSAFGPLLVSRNKQTIWPRREAARAFCNNGPLSQHDAPALGCECGFYAFSTPDHKDLKNQYAIWGELYMWGEVIVCEEGYRSEFAYPKNLFLRDNGTKGMRWLQEKLSLGYGIPVFLVAEREGKLASEIVSELLSTWKLGDDVS